VIGDALIDAFYTYCSITGALDDMEPSPVTECQPRCGEVTVFYPGVEDCLAICSLPEGHDGPHADEGSGRWTDEGAQWFDD
jgi:hypothetical protein